MYNKHMTIWISIALTIIIPCTCFPAEKQAEQDRQENQQQPRNPHRRIRSIEQLVYLQENLIQKRYRNRIDNLKMRARRHAENLGYPDRLLWVEFIKMTRGADSPNRYFLTPSFLEYKTFELRDAMMKSYSVYAARDLLLDDRAYQVITEIESSPSYGTLIRRQARKVLNIMRQLRLTLSRIERQRKAELARLQRWKKQTAEDVSMAVDYLSEQPETARPGVVTAIISTPTIRSAMINDEVVHDGDSLKDVKILKIHPDKVDFQKDGNVWTQKLGQPQQKFWQ
jgi:hypothetical protein